MNDEQLKALALHWLPTDPPRPCPDVLTADEAACYLRLDRSAAKDPARSLDRYRAQGLIRGVQIGKDIRFRRIDLDKFVEQRIQDQMR